MSKLIVWDLFGGSMNSVYHSLKENDNYEIWTLDINNNIQHDKQIIHDLSNPNFKELEKLPKPDIIVSSPLCTSFSHILNASGGRLGWEFKNNEWVIRDIKDIEHLINKNKFFRHYNAQNILENAIIGKKCLDATISIIEHFKPKYWYIENPKLSLMWKMIKLNGVMNLAYYYCYDNNFTQKPTIFYSNINLDLKHHKVIDAFKKVNKNATRSKINNLKCSYSKNEQGANVAIPKELIRDIFKKFK